MTWDETFDYVVVGGGTAGAVVAARLSEDGDASVCLVESGPSDAGDGRILELRRWHEVVYGEDLACDYAIEPQERGNGAIVQMRSRVLGGCSAHNTCIAFEAPPSDLRAWAAAAGSDAWGPEAVAPLWDRIRERVVIAPCPPTNALAQAFVAAAGEAGFPHVAFGRGEVPVGAGWYNVNADGTNRESSAAAYLHRTPRPERRLTIRTGTLATRVVLEDGAAQGVETTAGRIRAEREVILCGGSFESPKLLMLSGIGDEAELRRHGIDVRHHLPGVGRHLVDHPEAIVLFEASRPVPERVLTDWEAGLFARSAPDVEVPDIMFHLASMTFDKNTCLRGYPTAEHVFSMHPNVARARSEGTVRLRDANPASRPLVDPAYFTDPDGYDERIALAGVKLAREIGRQPALADWVVRELAPGPEIADDAALAEYARLTANTVYHPSGTCKMGADDDAAAVVDAQLRVRGIERLRVADTSIYPSITTVNPAMTCFMVGEQCAGFVLGAQSPGSPVVEERALTQNQSPAPRGR